MMIARKTNRLRNTGRMEGREEENDRITKLLREPSKELVTFVALAIRDSQLGPARAAIGAICDWIKND